MKNPLGSRGSNLAALAKPLLRKGKPAKISADARAFLPWLAKHASPELRAWTRLVSTRKLSGTYRGAFSVPAAYTFSHAVAGVEDDGCWVARVRSVFCAVSPILEEDEELWVASWFSTKTGESPVFYTHQDEDDFAPHRPSIVSFVVDQIEREAEREEEASAAAPDVSKAARAAGKQRVKIPPHLDPVRLQPRCDWIQGLFLRVGDRVLFDDGRDTAPSFAAWKKERAIVKRWPHLQAYWLLYHLVFDNRDALAELVKIGDRRYPATRELVSFAESVLAGKAVRSKIWDDQRVSGLRVQAFESGKKLFGEDSLARLRGAKAATGGAVRGVAAARARVEAEAKKDEAVRKSFELWKIFETFAGKLPALEQGVTNNLPDEDRMRVFLWNRRGNGTMLRELLWQFSGGVDARWHDLCAGALDVGAKFAEDHAKSTLGALAGLGVAMGEWEPFATHVGERLGAPASLGRLRRLEAAVVAQRLLEKGAEDEGALAFLRGEADRFAEQIDSFQSDTAASALGWLVRRHDPRAIAALERIMKGASFSGANWTTLLAFVNIVLTQTASPAFAPAMLAALEKGLGRHDDGDRALVARAYAACDGPAAVAELERLLANVDDVRVECERAALVAGLLQAEGGKHAERAVAVLDALLADKPGSMELGAAISLLQAAHAKDVRGFGDRPAALLGHAKKDKYVKTPLVTWLADKGPSLA